MPMSARDRAAYRADDASDHKFLSAKERERIMRVGYPALEIDVFFSQVADNTFRQIFPTQTRFPLLQPRKPNHSVDHGLVFGDF